MADKNYMLLRFGRKVRMEREKRNISQEKLGELADVHRTYVGMIERGEKNITLLNIEKIAQAFDLPLKQLMDF
jgi:transcriptional regulator with XRE-family HTH domain